MTVELEPGEFHWRDGITFRRLSDGSVRLKYPINPRGDIETRDIPAPEWATIVAHVSTDGGSAESFAKATALHG